MYLKYLPLRHKASWMFLGILMIFIYLLASNMAAYLRPHGFVVRTQNIEEQKLKELMGEYSKNIFDLKCTCHDCDPLSAGIDRVCQFIADPDDMQEMMGYVGFEREEIDQKKKPYENMQLFSRKCAEFVPFSVKFINPQQADGGLREIFYNEATKNACVEYDYSGQE